MGTHPRRRSLRLALALAVCALSAPLAPSIAQAEAAAAAQQTARFTVEGLTCSGCAGGVEKALEAREGVIEATVSYDDKLATIVYDSAATDAAALQAAIEGLGYQAEAIAEDDEDG